MSTFAVMLAYRGFVLVSLLGCSKTREALPFEIEVVPVKLDARANHPDAAYDPLALALAAGPRQTNPNPAVPADCYARTDSGANSCAACHTRSSYPNLTNDWELQQNYPFFELATNHWKNQFRDRRGLVDRFSDDQVAEYIRTDNYEPLRAALANRAFPGWKPDLDFTRGFDELGFAVDGSGWRALRYKPFAVMVASNLGNADDAFVRLPRAFRVDHSGRSSIEIYRTNLAILEAAITADPTQETSTRTIEAIDERASGIDLDRDGVIGTANKVVGLPAHFAGGAASIGVIRSLYPQGVEFLHTVRYLDPDNPAGASRRMKEVRYSTKDLLLEDRDLARAHRAIEQPSGGPTGDPLHGYSNGLGWRLQGWIEDASGWLRLQTHEEHQFCIGCHSNLGVAVDQTFSFPRKVPGSSGWRPQDPRGIPDVPALGEIEPELERYAKRARTSLELNPSAARALELDRRYLANVLEQSYVWGRNAVAIPSHARIEERSTGLGERDRVVRDVSLLLDWTQRVHAAAP